MYSLRKLQTVLQGLTGDNLSCGSIFGQPNLERQLGADDATGTADFGASQIDMNFQWQIIEELAPGRTDVRLRNYRHWLDESGVDLRSSVHMIFDVFDQLIDVIIIIRLLKKNLFIYVLICLIWS